MVHDDPAACKDIAEPAAELLGILICGRSLKLVQIKDTQISGGPLLDDAAVDSEDPGRLGSHFHDRGLNRHELLLPDIVNQKLRKCRIHPRMQPPALRIDRIRNHAGEGILVEGAEVILTGDGVQHRDVAVLRCEKIIQRIVRVAVQFTGDPVQRKA